MIVCVAADQCELALDILQSFNRGAVEIGEIAAAKGAPEVLLTP
jgi:hypothetical protein